MTILIFKLSENIVIKVDESTTSIRKPGKSDSRKYFLTLAYWLNTFLGEIITSRMLKNVEGKE